MFTTRMYNLIATARNRIIPMLFTLALYAPFGDGEDAFCDLLSAFQSFALKLAFIGTVAGLIVFGISKVWSIISPDGGGQGRDYLKNLGMGILVIAGAGAIASMIFSLDVFGGDVMCPDVVGN